MSDDKKEVAAPTEQAAAIPYELFPSSTSNPLELTKEIGDWILGLPPEFRKQNRFILEVKGRGVFLDVEKATVEIRPAASHLEIIPL